jgi:hypothetical protein
MSASLKMETRICIAASMNMQSRKNGIVPDMRRKKKQKSTEKW